jgi:hypothetical protein
MSTAPIVDDNVGFEAFRDEWMREVTTGEPSTLELGRRFAQKLVPQWLDLDPGSFSTDIVYCDGSGDGGIDIAYLDRGDDDEAPEATSSHTWYLIQSKYGSAFQGNATLLQEGKKVIDTLDGRTSKLSSLAEGLLERLTNFRNAASERDRIILVFATVERLDMQLETALGDVRAMGRERLGSLFDVEAVSVETVYQRLVEEMASGRSRLQVPMGGSFVPCGQDLLIGSIGLIDLYEFLVAYRARTEDLDQLYERNVRRFLGSRGRVNKGIQATLRDAPERFGLFNNGITVVVAGYDSTSEHELLLTEPYIVNGCQTTRTIWEVCHQKLEAGGTGEDPALEEWRQRAGQGVVVTKIVKVGDDGEEMLQSITRYTNSQNAVREKDFLALTSDFRRWASQMADQYGVFLEIQRGAWDSRRAYQRQHPAARQFEHSANAFDLIKVYGAGWLGEAGLAFGKNPPFLPNGSVFKRIMNDESAAEPFGLDDLYASYLVQRAADRLEFGRGGRLTRRQTRFLFYMVVVDLLKDILTRANIDRSLKHVSAAFLKVLDGSHEAAANALVDAAVNVIDTYMTQGEENSAFEEPALRNSFNGDVNGFLKWEQVGKNGEATPRLKTLIEVTKMAMGQGFGDRQSTRTTLMDAVRSA